MKLTKKTIALGIIIVAVVAIAVFAVIFGPRIITRLTAEPSEFEQTLTEMSGNVGREISDEDLRELELAVREVIGDKFISVERADGFAPGLNLGVLGLEMGGELLDMEAIGNMPEEQYYALRHAYVGDRFVLTSELLTEDEQSYVYGAISSHFDFANLREQPAWAERHNYITRPIYRVVSGD